MYTAYFTLLCACECFADGANPRGRRSKIHCMQGVYMAVYGEMMVAKEAQLGH